LCYKYPVYAYFFNSFSNKPFEMKQFLENSNIEELENIQFSTHKSFSLFQNRQISFQTD